MAFADAVGNAHLRLPGLFLHVEGRKPAPQGVRRLSEGERVWRGPALRVIFFLLIEPDLIKRPVRELATVAGTAPGTVMGVFKDLEASGNLVRVGPRERRFVRDQLLIETWMDGFIGRLRPGLLIGRFEALKPEWWRDFDPVPLDAQWGGEVGAHLLGADLRPATQTVYTRERPTKLLKAANLRRNEDGPVELRRRFWNEAPDGPRDDVVHPLLVTGDLLVGRDGRRIAAAQQLMEEYVDGLVDPE